MSNYPPPPPPPHPEAPQGTYLASDGKFYALQPQRPPPRPQKKGKRGRVGSIIIVLCLGFGWLAKIGIDIKNDVKDQVDSGGSSTATIAGPSLEDQVVTRIGESLAVKVVSFVTHYDSGEYEVMTALDLTNKSAKTIRGFQVTITVEATDRLSRNWTRNLRVESTTPMGPGQHSVCSDPRKSTCEIGLTLHSYGMNQFIPQEIGFWNALKEGSSTVSIKPTFLVFEDGTSVGNAR